MIEVINVSLASRPVDSSMSLLADLASQAQDPAYAQAAKREIERPTGSLGRRRRAALGSVLLALVGLLIGIGADAVRSATGGDARQRAQLVGEVHRRTAESDALAGQVSTLRSQVAAQRDAALIQNALGRQQATQLGVLELAAGTVGVTGPGVVVTLGDRPTDKTDAPAQQRGGRIGDGRVLDRDLQDLVNGLWAAGAEAISINEQRLTARTAIRSAGEAILVDLRPLQPPYMVSAVGEPDALQPAFTAGPAARRLTNSSTLYGLRFEVRSATRLTLPAGGSPDLAVGSAAPR